MSTSTRDALVFVGLCLLLLVLWLLSLLLLVASPGALLGMVLR